MKHLLKISAVSITFVKVFCTFQSNALAEGYRLPFPAGKSVQVTQSCIDKDEPDCEHSKEGNNYSLSQKYAIDFGCSIGDSIVAIQGGLVNLIDDDNGYNDGYGNLIKLKHSDNKYSFYAHLQSVNPFNIGDSILQGQEIGKCGNTGNSPDGSHLHLELRSGPSIVAGVISTERIYFDECKNNPPNCTDGQVVYPKTYTSLNGSNNNNTKVVYIPIEDGYHTIGSKIIAVSNGISAKGLSRRDTPGGKVIGSQDIAWERIGTYIGGSGFAPLNGVNYNWLNIDWGNGITGYSATDYLRYVYINRPISTMTTGYNESFTNPTLLPPSNLESVKTPESSSILGIFLVSVSGMLVRLKKKIW